MKLTKCFIAGECLYNNRRKEKTMGKSSEDVREICECCGLKPCAHSRIHQESSKPMKLISRDAYNRLKAERDELKADYDRWCDYAKNWKSLSELMAERDTAVKALGELKNAIESHIAQFDSPKIVCPVLVNALDKVKSLGIVPVSVEGGEASG